MNENDLRDCFAMFSMLGLLSGYQKPDEFTEDFLAKKAYIIADAMIEARKEEPEEGIVAIKKRRYVKKQDATGAGE